MKFEYVSCNLCGSNKTKNIGKRKAPDRDSSLESDIVQCLDCGLLYPNPKPCLEDSDIQRMFGFDAPKEYFSIHTHNRFRLFGDILRRIERLKPDKGSFLDVGCGRGELLYLATKNGWEATGTDVSKDFVRYAKETF
ncbi:MAG: class I SAM-dependent methyltransferase, partial [Candidatus Omnitrophica bacterium]|nr:class I SAM-dependent methyltransferase [Candidatus Omnitrophota bacterium]